MKQVFWDRHLDDQMLRLMVGKADFRCLTVKCNHGKCKRHPPLGTYSDTVPILDAALYVSTLQPLPTHGVELDKGTGRAHGTNALAFTLVGKIDPCRLLEDPLLPRCPNTFQ